MNLYTITTYEAKDYQKYHPVSLTMSRDSFSSDGVHYKTDNISEAKKHLRDAILLAAKLGFREPSIKFGKGE